MKTMGIIAEYNPFHNGHLLHLSEGLAATGATHSVAVMSGDFVQRGEPAILDKWTRARMAVDAGVNLVVELPVSSAIASAEGFARGAIELLHATGVVDCLSFGMEHPDLRRLQGIAEILTEEPIHYREALKDSLNRGLPFPAARIEALRAAGIEDAPETPNDILALEYVKAMRQMEIQWPVHPVPRRHVAYHSLERSRQFASATAIRSWIAASDFLSIRLVVPPQVYELIADETDFIFPQAAYPLLRHKIMSVTASHIASYRDVSEGLENRIVEAARQHGDWEGFLRDVKTRRYTLTRIQRIALNILLEIPDEGAWRAPALIRPLASDEKGRELLRAIKLSSRLPVIERLGAFDPADRFQLDERDLMVRAGDLHALLAGRPLRRDFRMPPYFKK